MVPGTIEMSAWHLCFSNRQARFSSLARITHLWPGEAAGASLTGLLEGMSIDLLHNNSVDSFSRDIPAISV
jgi:hypothetical protein